MRDVLPQAPREAEGQGDDMRKWFYVDITTTCRERVAVKAEDEEQAKDAVGSLVDDGTIDFADANSMVYGSIRDSITVAEREFKKPPRAMRKFDRGEEVI